MRSSRTPLAAGLLALAVISGCAPRPEIPPVTSAADATPRPGTFVWHDLLTEDLAKTEAFYGELLGWTFEPTDVPDYHLIRNGGRAIGGVVDLKRRKLNESQWVSVLSVENVDQAASRTRDGGGAIRVEPVDLPGRGRLAVVSDPQGALLAYLRASHGDPPDEPVRLGDFLWNELWSADPEASEAFYSGLVGYSVDQRTVLGHPYTIFTRADRPRAGLIQRPTEQVRSHWLPYVRVEDPAAMESRVSELGGTVLLAADPAIREGTVIIVLDPSGAALALQKWETRS